MFQALKRLFAPGPSRDVYQVTPKPLVGVIVKGDYGLDVSTAHRLLEFNTSGQTGAMDCIWTYHVNVTYYLSVNHNFVLVIRDLDKGNEVTSIKQVEKKDVISDYGMIQKFPTSYHLIYVDESEIRWTPEVL